VTGRAKEAWVGAGVMLLFVLLVGWASGGGRNATRDGYTLTARFEQVDGVAVGTPVRLAGMQIGRVSNVRLDAKALKPILTFTLRHKIRLPVDSAALIMSDGVLGDKFIKIEPGSEDEMLAPGEAFEFAQSSIILEHILHRVVVTAEERLRPLKEGPPKNDKPTNGEKK
jgi:phospholipid/cholesterol/gamma-HCH transport system substrate-binding protein